MEQFEHISVQQTQQLLSNQQAKLVDIRDEASFNKGHVEGAIHLDNGSLSQFVADTELATPIVVCCYHGISSQQAAQYLILQGFEQVYSMDGGFEAWRSTFPHVCGSDS